MQKEKCGLVKNRKNKLAQVNMGFLETSNRSGVVNCMDKCFFLSIAKFVRAI